MSNRDDLLDEVIRLKNELYTARQENQRLQDELRRVRDLAG